MSSLAFYGSPIDYHNNIMENNNSNISTKNTDTIINKKRNKTQKNSSYIKTNTIEPFYSEKVNNILNTIHNSPPQDDDDNNFKPIPPPNSIGVQKTIDNEKYYLEQNQSSKINKTDNNDFYDNSDNSDNDTNYLKNNLPINNINFPLLSSNDIYNDNFNFQKYNNPNQTNTNDVLINKLNYMIHLLEEKNDEKTGNVLEEVILYSFLGIFIIFLVDTFTRLGKYKR
jgi:hypothetical protein